MAFKISGTTVIDDSRNISNTGVVTATSFVGSGSGLTGVSAGITSTSSINTSGIITASIVSANQFVGSGDKLIFSPTITTFNPIDGTTNVGYNSQIILTFDQPIYAGVGTITLRNSSGIGTIIQSIGIGSTSVSISSQTLTITPNTLPAGTNVFVVLPQGVITNSVGGNISTVSTYKFTTATPSLGDAFGGGFLICQSGGTRWIVAPSSSQVTRGYSTRNDAITTAQQVSGCTGWFIPSISQLQNPGYTCRSFWDSYCLGNYRSNTLNPANGCPCILNFNTGGPYGVMPYNQPYFVRALRCVAY